MRENVWVLIVTVAVAGFVSRDARAERIRALVREKPYEVSIELKDFEPEPMPLHSAILGGCTKDGTVVEITAGWEKPGITPAELRTRHTRPEETGIEETTILTSNTGEMLVLFYPWEAPGTPAIVIGFAVKDDLGFDVLLWADLAVHPKEELLAILKSFEVSASAEPGDRKSLLEKLHAGPSPTDQETLIKDFVQKYPLSSWGYAMLGEHYFHSEQRDRAKQAYVQAIENHRTHSLMEPRLLCKCYDGLGICYRMAGEYDEAKRCIELGYELARRLQDDLLLAASRYNYACWYAQTNNAEKSIEYLERAVERDSGKKREAKEDASFKNLRENEAFKRLVGQ